MPQPSMAPDHFSPINEVASSKKLSVMPEAVAADPRRTSRKLPPASHVNAKSLIESTGSTQGIRLRIRPPSKAESSAAKNSEPLSGIAWAAGTLNSAARFSSISVAVKGRPAGGNAASRTVRRAALPASCSSTSGAGGIPSPTPSTSRSGRTKTPDLLLRSTTRVGFDPGPEKRVPMTSTPAASGEPGTRFWAELINPDWAEVSPAPVGNASVRSA